MHPCSASNHNASIPNLKTNPLYKEEIWKSQWRTQNATHHPWGSNRQGAVGWSSSPRSGTQPGIQSLARRGDGGCWEGCTLGDGVTNVSSTIKMTLNGLTKKKPWQAELQFRDVNIKSINLVPTLGWEPGRKPGPRVSHFVSCRE